MKVQILPDRKNTTSPLQRIDVNAVYGKRIIAENNENT
jgi:hypothetical protein